MHTSYTYSLIKIHTGAIYILENSRPWLYFPSNGCNIKKDNIELLKPIEIKVKKFITLIHSLH